MGEKFPILGQPGNGAFENLVAAGANAGDCGVHPHVRPDAYALTDRAPEADHGIEPRDAAGRLGQHTA